MKPSHCLCIASPFLLLPIAPSPLYCFPLLPIARSLDFLLPSHCPLVAFPLPSHHRQYLRLAQVTQHSKQIPAWYVETHLGQQPISADMHDFTVLACWCAGAKHAACQYWFAGAHHRQHTAHQAQPICSMTGATKIARHGEGKGGGEEEDVSREGSAHCGTIWYLKGTCLRAQLCTPFQLNRKFDYRN